MISFEHHSKLDILSHSLHFDFLCFDLSMNSWVSLRPYVIDIITPNHSAQETSKAVSFDTQLPTRVPIGPKHLSITYHDNIHTSAHVSYVLSEKCTQLKFYQTMSQNRTPYDTFFFYLEAKCIVILVMPIAYGQNQKRI